VTAKYIVACAAFIAALVANARAQEGIDYDHEGTFSGSMPPRSAVADTIHVSNYEMTWIRHGAKGRSECTTSVAGEYTEVGIQLTNAAVTWKCDKAAQVPTVVDFEYPKDRWVMRDAAGEKPFRAVFARVGKKVWAEDLLPRAAQPPAAVADSVVRAVRALYERVNGYPCVTTQYWNAPFTICSRGGAIGRVRTEDKVEAFVRNIEYTYDSAGALRFVFEETHSAERSTNRYYFAGGHLVRWLVANDTTTTTKFWNPSQSAWTNAENEMLGLAAKCLATARAPVDSASDGERNILDCEVQDSP
jgi:hypothetical protein